VGRSASLEGKRKDFDAECYSRLPDFAGTVAGGGGGSDGRKFPDLIIPA